MFATICWILAVLGLMGFILYSYFPMYMVQLKYRIHLFRSGLSRRTLRLGNKTVVYAERGQASPIRPSIVFLHGFSSNKESWANTIKNLPEDIHTIAFDLPSHGETSYNISDQGMVLDAFVESLHQFIRVLGLDRRPFHLVGLSMGGSICGKYSASYPENVECISLICPSMRTPELSTLSRQLALNKDDPNIPYTPVDLQKSMDLTCHRKLTFNKQMLKGILQMRGPRNEHHVKLIQTLRSDKVRQSFLDCLPLISVPTQVIWGEDDKLIDISGVSTLRAHLPNLVRVDIVPGCGHSISLDHPQHLAKLLLLHNKSMPYLKGHLVN